MSLSSILLIVFVLMLVGVFFLAAQRQPGLPATRWRAPADTRAAVRPPRAASPGDGRAVGCVTPAQWNLMFEALCERLRHAALDPTAAPSRDLINSCLVDLDLLRAALDPQRGYLRRIEAELRQSCADLAIARASESEALRLAAHDGLTELPDRIQFRRRLDSALGTAPAPPPTLAVLLLDLDDFKPINNRHGHDTGDELLRIVARRLIETVRSEDIVFRLGGDQFACLLLQPIARVQLVDMVGRLFDAVSAPLPIGALTLQVHPSIGIAVCPTDGVTTAGLLHSADAAMYRAKGSRVGYAFFDSRPETLHRLTSAAQ